MKTICVLQHVEAEYLGLMEDHMEGRNIRFRYFRPFTAGGMVPTDASEFDGLILLGAGPLGVVSGQLLPSMAPELRLTRDFLARELPIIGIETGAILLCVAAGGGADEAPLRFSTADAIRTSAEEANWLPERFPLAYYLRDRPVLPEGATVIAEDTDGTPLAFSLADNVIGFIGHPGMKSGMVEDIVMEFEETPDDIAEQLELLRTKQAGIAEALGPILIELVARTGWMTRAFGDDDEAAPPNP